MEKEEPKIEARGFSPATPIVYSPPGKGIWEIETTCGQGNTKEQKKAILRILGELEIDGCPARRKRAKGHKKGPGGTSLWGKDSAGSTPGPVLGKKGSENKKQKRGPKEGGKNKGLGKLNEGGGITRRGEKTKRKKKKKVQKARGVGGWPPQTVL